LCSLGSLILQVSHSDSIIFHFDFSFLNLIGQINLHNTIKRFAHDRIRFFVATGVAVFTGIKMVLTGGALFDFTGFGYFVTLGRSFVGFQFRHNE
jgi:hypothetical protein